MDQDTQNIKKDNPDDPDTQESPENITGESEVEKKTQENLTKKVQEAYSKNEDFQNKYIRVLADLENLKRRQIKEREEAVQRTRSQIIGDLLPSLDAFQMGMQEVEKEESTKNIFIGISMAFKQMENTKSYEDKIDTSRAYRLIKEQENYKKTNQEVWSSLLRISHNK